MEVTTMPNWVKVIVHALNENVDFEEFTNEKGDFTFEKIVPMPENIYRGDLGPKERAKYGRDNWYDWSYANWGTKWDACESNVQGSTVTFETAWSCPEPVLRELAKKVGGLLVFYADEDIGSNCGAFFVKKNGEMVEVGMEYVFAEVIRYGIDIEDRECISEFDWILGDEDEDDE